MGFKVTVVKTVIWNDWRYVCTACKKCMGKFCDKYVFVLLQIDNDSFVLHSQYLGCWCSGDLRNVNISSQIINLSLQEYSGIILRGVNIDQFHATKGCVCCCIYSKHFIRSIRAIQFSLQSFTGPVLWIIKPLYHPGPRLNIKTVFPRYGYSHVYL